MKKNKKITYKKKKKKSSYSSSSSSKPSRFIETKPKSKKTSFFGGMKKKSSGYGKKPMMKSYSKEESKYDDEDDYFDEGEEVYYEEEYSKKESKGGYFSKSKPRKKSKGFGKGRSGGKGGGYRIKDDVNEEDVDFSNVRHFKDVSDIDLVFVVDETGSMGSWINSAKTNIKEIVKKVTAKKNVGSIRIGLVSYRDHPPQDYTHVTRVFDLARTDTKMDQIQGAINRMQASGGGDGPESTIPAIHDLVRMSWRAEAAKTVVLICDAPPHGVGGSGDGFPNGDPSGVDWVEQAESLAEMGIICHGVTCGSGGVVKTVLKKIARITQDISSSQKLVSIITGATDEVVDKEIFTDKLCEHVVNLQEELYKLDEEKRIKYLFDELKKKKVKRKVLKQDKTIERDITLSDIIEGVNNIRRKEMLDNFEAIFPNVGLKKLSQRVGLFSKDKKKKIVIPLVNVEIKGKINESFSEIELKQTYYNDSDNPLEVEYKFPVPLRSTIYYFEAKMDDKIFIGKCMEKEKAKEVYDNAISYKKINYYNNKVGTEIYKWVENLPKYNLLPVKEQKSRCRLQGGGSKPKLTFELEVSILEDIFFKNLDSDKVSDDKIKEIGKKVLQKHNINNNGELICEFSNGWLFRFKGRYGLRFQLNGKLRDVKTWKSVLSSAMWEMRDNIVQLNYEHFDEKLFTELLDHILGYDESAWRVFKRANGTISIIGIGDLKVKEKGNEKLRHTFTVVHNALGLLVVLMITFKARHLSTKSCLNKPEVNHGVRNINLKALEKYSKKKFGHKVYIVVNSTKSGFTNHKAITHMYERGIIPYLKSLNSNFGGVVVSDTYYSHRNLPVNPTNDSNKLEKLMDENKIFDISIAPNTTGCSQVADRVVNAPCKRKYEKYLEKTDSDELDRMKMIKLLIKSLSKVDYNVVKMEFVKCGQSTKIGEEDKICFDNHLKVKKNFGLNLKPKHKEIVYKAFDQAKERFSKIAKEDDEEEEEKNVNSVCSLPLTRLRAFVLLVCREFKIKKRNFMTISKFNNEILDNFFVLEDLNKELKERIRDQIRIILLKTEIMKIKKEDDKEDAYELQMFHPLVSSSISYLNINSLESFETEYKKDFENKVESEEEEKEEIYSSESEYSSSSSDSDDERKSNRFIIKLNPSRK